MSRAEDLKSMELRLQHQLQENAALRTQISGIRQKTFGGSPTPPTNEPLNPPTNSILGNKINVRTPTRPRPPELNISTSPGALHFATPSLSNEFQAAHFPSEESRRGRSTSGGDAPSRLNLHFQTPSIIPLGTDGVPLPQQMVLNVSKVMYDKSISCCPTIATKEVQAKAGTYDAATDMRLHMMNSRVDIGCQTAQGDGPRTITASIPGIGNYPIIVPASPPPPYRPSETPVSLDRTVPVPQNKFTSPAAPMEVLEQNDRDWVSYVESILAARPFRSRHDQAVNTETEFVSQEDAGKLKYLVHQYEDMVLHLTDAIDQKTSELKNESDLNVELRDTIQRIERELEDIRIKSFREPFATTADNASKDKYIVKLQEEIDAYEIAVTTEWKKREERFAQEIRSVHSELDVAKHNAHNYKTQCELLTNEIHDLKSRIVTSLQSDLAQKEKRIQEIFHTQRELSNSILQKQDEVSNARLMLLQNDTLDTTDMQTKFHSLVNDLKSEYQKLYEDRVTREHEEVGAFYADTKSHIENRESLCAQLTEKVQLVCQEKSENEERYEKEISDLRREITLLQEEMNSALLSVMAQLDHKTRQVTHLLEVMHLNRGYHDALQLTLTTKGMDQKNSNGSGISLQEHADMMKMKDNEIAHLRETLHSEVNRQMDELRDVQVQFQRYERTIGDLERQLHEEKARQQYHLQVECAGTRSSGHDQSVARKEPPPAVFSSHANANHHVDSHDMSGSSYVQNQGIPGVGHLPSTSHSTLYDLLYKK